MELILITEVNKREQTLEKLDWLQEMHFKYKDTDNVKLIFWKDQENW